VRRGLIGIAATMRTRAMQAAFDALNGGSLPGCSEQFFLRDAVPLAACEASRAIIDLAYATARMRTQPPQCVTVGAKSGSTGSVQKNGAIGNRSSSHAPKHQNGPSDRVECIDDLFRAQLRQL